MNATEWAAWVGALGFGWHVYTWVYTRVHTGPQLRIRAVANFVKRPSGSNRFKFCPIDTVMPVSGEPKFLRITVENRGNGPTTIQALMFETYLSRWARFWRRASPPYGYLPSHEGPQLPYPLDDGRECVAHIEQDDDFNKWASSGNLWFGVVHSCSTWPVLGKASYPK